MALKIKLGKADYDALDESLKTLYVQDGDSYKLDADYEDVTGLKAKNEELLGKLKAAVEAGKAFEGMDPEKAREALKKLEAAADDDLLNKRKYDELIAKKTAEWEEEKKTLTEKVSALVNRSAEKDLAVKLTAAGVKPSVANDLALILKANHIKPVEDGNDVVWKSLDGLETIDLDKFIPGLKESKADYFGSTLGEGSGASGSDGTGGGADLSKMDPIQLLDQANAATK